MQSISSLRNIKGKRVLVRVDFNVPVLNGKISDSFRIKKAFKTISFLKKKGAKIILISHFGKGEESMKVVSLFLNKFFKNTFISELDFSKLEKKTKEMKNGDILFLENLRFFDGEKKSDINFAKKLSLLGDIYVNESFSVSHRKDSSVFLLPKFLPHYAGFQIFEEVKNLSLFFKKTPKPFFFILGGAKFSTKIPLIKKFLNKADFIFIGGALLNNLLKAKGFNVGKSLVDEEVIFLDKLLKSKKLILPVDVVVENRGVKANKKIEEVLNDDTIIDIGFESREKISEYIKKSKIILWNGPLGKYENGGDEATKYLLKVIAKNKTKSVLGGGDTVALISKLKLEEKFTFVSTGGGATLDFLSNGTLPGIKALG